MPNSIWTGAYGRLKALSTNFLSKEYLIGLIKLRDSKEIAESLESTWYRSDIEAAASVYKPPELVEVALNRHLVAVNNLAVTASPPYGKAPVLAYLAKWDIHNIELILAAKSVGRTVEDTEPYLVSSRNIPVGIAGGIIPFGELKILLSQPDAESVINYLVKYGYGAALLQHLPEYQSSRDLGVLSAVLQNYYYSRLLWELRFLRGDEGVIREYIRAEISKKNVLTLLKARESELSREVVSRHLIEGGLIGTQSLLEAYSAPSLGELIQKFEPWFSLSEAAERYQRNRNLSEMEVAMDRVIAQKNMRSMKNNSISAASVLAFVLQAEYERENIRRIVYGRHYGLSEEDINAVLLFW
jgi:V/A-type H+-transporting ATPase subunit C